MKKATHPTVHPAIFVDSSCGAEFVTVSTLTSEKTKDIKGITYMILPVEISSASHPFFTGKQVLIDTARRVEKFGEKMKKVEAAAASRKGKKVKKAKMQAKREADKPAKAAKEKEEAK